MPKIFTSYFGQLKSLAKNGIIPISIARYSPGYYKGYTLLEVAPTGAMLKMDEEAYRRAYAEILRHVDANKLLRAIEGIGRGRNVALLCYEKPGELCHRRLLAEWIQKSVGVEVAEWGVSKNPKVEQLSLF